MLIKILTKVDRNKLLYSMWAKGRVLNGRVLDHRVLKTKYKKYINHNNIVIATISYGIGVPDAMLGILNASSICID